ncbi:antiviral reverse transcriptase Drt3b [Roseibium sp. RP-7]
MYKEPHDKIYWRPLLTETLPYEVPMIFSNDLFYGALNNKFEGKSQVLFDALLPDYKSFTKPLNYKIIKDRGGKTTLSIIHPFIQIKMARHYNNYESAIVSYCSRSEYSIRYPIKVTKLYSENETAEDNEIKSDEPQIERSPDEQDYSHIANYFTYSKYNLLLKFIDSREYIDLEKKYSKLRNLDVSRCFYNIYTHSITWAVKDKDFAKINKDHHTFESVFDQIMQRANYNETNGIVVGPEVSRIFAEIIFQRVDREIERKLAEDFQEGEFVIRRYVDDYFIFSNSMESLDRIEEVISEELEKYKLYINEDKRNTASRPFVSDITLARRDISDVIDEIRAAILRLDQNLDEGEVRKIAKGIRRSIQKLRLVTKEYNVGFHTISGWILSRLRSLFGEIASVSKSADWPETSLGALSDVGAAIIELSFYIISLDVRVRTTYSLFQILTAIQNFSKKDNGEYIEYLNHIAFEELNSLTQNFSQKYGVEDLNECVELMNLFICGAVVYGSDFVDDTRNSNIIKNTLSEKVSYFGYISAKFCMQKSKKLKLHMKELDDIVEGILLFDVNGWKIDCERYLLLVDYLSSDTVALSSKKKIIDECVNIKRISDDEIKDMCATYAYADWRGIRIKYLLKRKQLRSVYSWS